MWQKITSYITVIGPGLLVAATGVGAGDLATATFTGIKVGPNVIWMVVLGAFFKYFLNEGIMRYQLGSSRTILSGAKLYIPSWCQKIFLGYFFIWSYLVAAALMSANGVVLYAIFPLFDQASSGKIIFGILASILSLWLILQGGYRLFEKVMKITIGLMFATVLITVFQLVDVEADILKGALKPTFPFHEAEKLAWSLALMGGVGGTVTILNYGYWMREEGRIHQSDVEISRRDLIFAYTATALFGICMVFIGNHIEVEGKGAGLIVNVAEALNGLGGQGLKWMFLVGAFGAVFSSMLGVWQGVPYLFADMISNTQEEMLVLQPSYKYFAIALAIVPMTGLVVGFASMQQLYALIGALFIPILAISMLWIFNRDKDIKGKFELAYYDKAILGLILLFFLVMLIRTIYRIFF